MSRWNPDESLARPWQMLREMRGSGDGYRISGANPKGESIGIYCSRADLDLIIEAVNAYETLRTENARYREALEDIVHCIYSNEATLAYCEKKAREALKGGE